MFNRLRFPTVFFFMTSLVGLLTVNYTFGGTGRLMFCGVFAYGLVVGIAVQRFFREPIPKVRVGISSFCAIFVLWIPVIMQGCPIKN